MTTPLDIVLIIGPPGAGKGTQATRMVAHHGLTHISTGDILRDEIEKGTEAGKLASHLNAEGKLFPDGLIIEMLFSNLPDGPALLDGFPRTVNQAEALDAMCAKSGRRISHVLCLDVDTDLLVDRILHRRNCTVCKSPTTDAHDVCPLCNGELSARADDNAATLVERINRYKVQTLPVATRHYDGQTIMIDGSQEITRVQQSIDKALS